MAGLGGDPMGGFAVSALIQLFLHLPASIPGMAAWFVAYLLGCAGLVIGLCWLIVQAVRGWFWACDHISVSER